MDAILAGVTTVVTLVGGVFDAITGNAYLATIAAAGLLTIGISIFTALRGASHG